MKERMAVWIAWRLPRRVVYWAAIRLGSSAAVGEYRNQVVPELTVLKALSRWEEKRERAA